MKIKNIELIIYDFDGVMTDNRVLVFEDGKEAVFVNRSDGLAVNAIKKMGIDQIIVSTEKNSVVRFRAKKLGIPFIQSVADKKKTVEKYLKKNKIQKEKVVFMGNDTNDKEVMGFIGWPAAPADAHPDVKKIARLKLKTKGGFGVVRELYNLLREAEK